MAIEQTPEEIIKQFITQNPEVVSQFKQLLQQAMNQKTSENTSENSEDNDTQLFVNKPVTDISSFIKFNSPESYYIVTFDIDQRDADYITVSSYQKGKISAEELIKLDILANHSQLSDYDGEWYNLGALDEFLKEYLSGKFYEPCNRFSVNNIEIKGYDADRNQFYTIEMPDLEQLGIDDIDEAYKTYFNVENED